MKPTHGGKRPNAGRKPTQPPRMALTVRLSEPARISLARIKQATGESHSAIFERMIEKEAKGLKP